MAYYMLKVSQEEKRQNNNKKKAKRSLHIYSLQSNSHISKETEYDQEKMYDTIPMY